MKKPWLRFILSVEGIIGALYFLPLWYFPNNPKTNCLDSSSTLGSILLTAFIAEAVLSIVTGLIGCINGEKRLYNVLSVLSNVFTAVLLPLFAFLSFIMIMELFGLQWFPNQN